MAYLGSSYDAIKGFYASGYELIKSATIKYGKLGGVFIHSIALDYPISSLITANLILIYLAKKVAVCASKIIAKLTFGIIPVKITAPIVALGIIIAGNYCIYNYANLKFTLEVALIVPSLTFAAVMIVYRLIRSKSGQKSELAVENNLVDRDNKSKIFTSITKHTNSLTEEQKAKIVSRFEWWNPNDQHSLEFQNEFILAALLKVIKNTLVPIPEASS
jgi:hypothetical protein